MFQIFCVFLSATFVANFLNYLIDSARNLQIKDKQFLGKTFTFVSDLGLCGLVISLQKSFWLDNRKLINMLTETRLDINKKQEAKFQTFLSYTVQSSF